MSWFQFREKGFLFNNAYIYASKKERKTMDKTPHYRQSGVVFFLLGLIFALNAADIILQTGWLFYVVMTLAAVAVVYAIVSSVQIEKNRRK